MAGTLVLGACGGDKGSDVDTTSTTRGGVDTTESSLAPDSSESTSTTSAPGGQAATTTTAKGAAGTGTTAVPGAKGAYAHSPAGSYGYHITGKASSPAFGSRDVNGDATLTVDPPAGTDQHSRLVAEGVSTDQVLRFAPDGVRLLSIKTVQQGITKEFRFEPPVMMLPADVKVGQTWEWSGTSTDGKTKVSSSFRHSRREPLTVAGRTFDTWVLDATVTTSGDITSTSKQTIWYAQELRVIAKQRDNTNGTFGQVSFTSDTTRTLTRTP
jgi:hypothetical protein